MSSTLTNLLYHIVFSTKNRESIITKPIRAELYKYIGGIIRGEGGILLEIGGMPDHAHLIVYPYAPKYKMSRIPEAIKQPVGAKAIAHLNATNSGWLPRLTRKRGKRIERRGGCVLCTHITRLFYHQR